MASRIEVERNASGGSRIAFIDRNGFTAVEVLTAAQVEELIGKLRGTWTPDAPTVTPFIYEQAPATVQALGWEPAPQWAKDAKHYDS